MIFFFFFFLLGRMPVTHPSDIIFIPYISIYINIYVDFIFILNLFKNSIVFLLNDDFGCFVVYLFLYLCIYSLIMQHFILSSSFSLVFKYEIFKLLKVHDFLKLCLNLHIMHIHIFFLSSQYR